MATHLRGERRAQVAHRTTPSLLRAVPTGTLRPPRIPMVPRPPSPAAATPRTAPPQWRPSAAASAPRRPGCERGARQSGCPISCRPVLQTAGTAYQSAEAGQEAGPKSDGSGLCVRSTLPAGRWAVSGPALCCLLLAESSSGGSSATAPIGQTCAADRPRRL